MRVSPVSIFSWLVIVIMLLAVLAVAAGQLGWLQGTPPIDLGVRDGRLKPPSMTENSVNRKRIEVVRAALAASR